MNSLRSTAIAESRSATCTRVLVIDPDGTAGRLLDAHADRFDVHTCTSAAEGLLLTGTTRPDVIVLRADLTDLPVPTVVDLLVRGHVPVIVAVDHEHAALAGAALDAGAMAFVAYPYRPAQLMALIAAVRPAPEPDDEVLRCGPLELSTHARTVRLRGTLVALPRQEFALLQFLMTNEGRVVSQARLWEAVWGGTTPSASNTVSVHVRRLRRRLGEDPRRPRIITTVGRSGYLLQGVPE
ncbi:response regulator transcription factor [Blastococcus atacamensis]|uniref:response regulator transcription factor n=1 Tax=Blastococcus atacamensis TaxID=2070508 RepID=UPI000CEC1A0A|nr:winged helix-turn-helix domain-containing protein [Blastococcus atacamensis]